MRLDIWRKRNNLPPKPEERQLLSGIIKGREIGRPVRYGPLEMIPLIGSPCQDGIFAPVDKSIGLTEPPTFGNIKLKNTSSKATIIPLNLGVLAPDQADHFLSDSWILKPGEVVELTDAASLPQQKNPLTRPGIGGLSFLPHSTKSSSFQLKGVRGYSKLWGKIEKLVSIIGTEKMEFRYREELSEVAKRMLTVDNQTGAIFMIYGNIVGIDMGPDSEYWAGIHPLIVQYAYGPLCLLYEDGVWEDLVFNKLDINSVRSVGNMKAEFEAQLKAREEKTSQRIAALGQEEFFMDEEQKVDFSTRYSLLSKSFAGQVIFHGNQPAYLSLFHQRISQI